MRLGDVQLDLKYCLYITECDIFILCVHSQYLSGTHVYAERGSGTYIQRPLTTNTRISWFRLGTHGQQFVLCMLFHIFYILLRKLCFRCAIYFIVELMACVCVFHTKRNHFYYSCDGFVIQLRSMYVVVHSILAI